MPVEIDNSEFGRFIIQLFMAHCDKIDFRYEIWMLDKIIIKSESDTYVSSVLDKLAADHYFH